MPGYFDGTYAFAPFFDETVAVGGRVGGRAVAQSLKACVVDAGPAEADPDAVCDTAETLYSVRVMRDEWADVEAPRRGFEVRLESGLLLRVTGVRVDGEWFELLAKSKGCAR